MLRFELRDTQLVSPELLEEADQARQSMESGNCAGNDFLGWMNLPETQSTGELAKIAEKMQNFDAVVMVGIGGSYLGFRAVFDALLSTGNPFHRKKPEILFAGHNLDAAYHSQLLSYLDDKSYGIVVISKSGTTTEPAVAFRLLMNHRSDDLKNRVVVITDEKKGTLRNLADELSLDSAVIADDVGGRFSVLSPVGILPMLIASVNADEILAGAREMAEAVRRNSPDRNPALLYAAYRNECYRLGKKTELFVSYHDRMKTFAEWWKQLYGESEGKNGKGIFPASVQFTTDLHSMGQWIQEAERTIFETVLDVEHDIKVPVPHDEKDGDGLNYLAGKPLHEVNRVAMQATQEAHHSGGVPIANLVIDSVSERTLGQLIYFFEYACGVSALMLGVNPFDQPGVEAYKKNMFRMLGKPGHS